MHFYRPFIHRNGDVGGSWLQAHSGYKQDVLLVPEVNPTLGVQEQMYYVLMALNVRAKC
jgi:hypothetical protein